jgi:hypothetical protein
MKSIKYCLKKGWEEEGLREYERRDKHSGALDAFME